MPRRRLILVLSVVSAAVVAVAACSSKPAGNTSTTPAPGGEGGAPPADRKPALAPGDATYAAFEGIDFKNDCQADAECFTGGCAGEVCTAQNDIVSACDLPPRKPDATCGCVAGQCIWWNTTGPAADTGGAGGGGSAGGGGGGGAQGTPCDAGGKCAAGLSCITYYGVAGPRGPKFTSCEIPCGGKQACPNGQSCITIADGPGQVCR